MTPDGIYFSLNFMGWKTSIIVNGRTQFNFVQMSKDETLLYSELS